MSCAIRIVNMADVIPAINEEFAVDLIDHLVVVIIVVIVRDELCR